MKNYNNDVFSEFTPVTETIHYSNPVIEEDEDTGLYKLSIEERKQIYHSNYPSCGITEVCGFNKIIVKYFKTKEEAQDYALNILNKNKE